MRGPKWLSIITFFISVVAIICILCFSTVADASLAYNISLAIFGSAVLGFIISLIEYFDIRRSVLEEFYLEALKINGLIHEAGYFYTDEPIEFVLDCIVEELNNSYNIKFYMETKHDARDKWINEYHRMHSLELQNCSDSNDLCMAIYKSTLNDYNEELEKCFDSYIDITNLPLASFDNAYGKINFIFGNKKFRMWIYQTIYTPIHNINRSAQEIVLQINRHRNGKGNKAFCAKMLHELNMNWFSIITKQYECGSVTEIYNNYSDLLDEKTQELWGKIYHKEPVNMQRYPIIKITNPIKEQ